MKITKSVKYTLAALAIAGITVTTAGCVPMMFPAFSSISVASETETRQFSYSDFDRIEVGSAFKVNVSRSDSASVSITLNRNLFDNLEVSQTGDTLQIGMKNFFPFFGNATMEVTVTLPELKGLELSGACRGEVSGFNSSQDMDLSVSGASTLKVSDLAAGNVRVAVSGASQLSGAINMKSGILGISGASTLELIGTATDTSLDVSGASTLRLTGFPMQKASVHLSGASNAEIEVSGQLDVFLSGASRLAYTGNPSLGSISVTGGSTLNHK
jgi:hypothetical protein